MPATKLQRRRVFLQTHLPWRLAFGGRTVSRRVQGVDLLLPWAHPLPDYARARATYGQNLIELARGLSAAAPGTLPVLDIGANVGDSAAQILAAVDAIVLCVEGDPYWISYLRRNLGGHQRVTLEEVLLVPDDGEFGGASAVRSGGTTRFVADQDPGQTPATKSVGELRRSHPDFDRLRLVKSDTDGFDTRLVPLVARAWADAAPVLFFEFDPLLSKAAGDERPHEVWAQLADLGYDRVAIWDNTGDPMGQLPMAEAAAASAALEPRPSHLGYDFWDVAVCHAGDQAARAVLDRLLPMEYSPLGSWR